MGGAKMKGVELRETSIRVKFTYRGKQVRETLTLNGKAFAPTPANIKYAARLVADIKKQIQCDAFDYAATFPDSKHAPQLTGLTGDESFFALIDRWHALLELKKSTKDQYRRHKDLFWKIHLPDKPIKSFVHSDIKKALLQGTWKSAKSRNNQLSLIRGVFELAVRDKQIPANPCDGLDYGKVQKKKPDPFTQDEVRLILAELVARYPEPIANFVQFQFYTGLRTSEGIALDWANVDFNRREILVDCALVYEEESDSTKTMVSRKVKLNSEAVDAIERQRAFTFLAGGKVFSDPYYDAPLEIPPDHQL
jgi:integrase